jgi:hypothetical protein
MENDTSFDNHAKDNTETLCANDPHAAVIRKTLIAMEREAHRTGWDGPDAMPRLFQLDTRQQPPRAERTWLDIYTSMLADYVNATDGDVGAGMMGLANGLTQSAHFQKTGEMPESWGTRISREELEAARDHFGLSAYEPGTDLYKPRSSIPGCRMYGWGMRSEGWVVVEDGSEETAAARKHGQLHRHPDRREMRSVVVVGRDGLVWSVARIRGGNGPEVVAARPDTREGFAGGGIVNALGRIVAAAVNNPFPVRPADTPY